MSLLRSHQLSLSFGLQPLLDAVDFTIEAGERVCLVGRNGCGKSTFFKILEGRIEPEEGRVECRPGLTVASLDQHLPQACNGTVFDAVADGLGELGELLSQYHRLSQQLADDRSAAALSRLEEIQHRLEAAGGWTLTQQVEAVISRLGLDSEADVRSLSGGIQRRVLLAQALVVNPDLLLLDEPTNHLDITSIEWLEDFLLEFRGTVLFITHDRRFLSRLATRILDLDRGKLTDWPGDYASYLQHKQALLDDEARQQALFDKKLAQEERWIRQGIKARRTRNEGRVRALEKLREQHRQRRQRAGTARFQANDAGESGKIVIACEEAGYSVANRTLIKPLDTLILRGDRVGVIGPNGAGKTTLLRLLLGELSPGCGHIRHGTRLETAYFDQRRAQLDEDLSVLDNLADGRQFIDLGDQQRHVISYLQDFLFTPERCHTPLSALSGGERNRLLLAKIFSKPSNLLVLDEPTNDLDMETLDLLEERLLEYAGTVLLVSHDRDFLGRVVTSTLVFEGDGRVAEYVGGYTDWLRQRPPPQSRNRGKPASAKPAKRSGSKLSFREQRELERLPGTIESLETDLDALQARMAETDFYRRSGDEIAAARQQLAALEAELQQAYRRWEHLEQAGK